MTPWPRIAVVGAGAVGSYFGGRLAQAGAPVTLIGRPGRTGAHLEAVARDGLWIRSASGDVHVATQVAGYEALSSATLILIAVKTVDTADVARRLVSHLAPDAIVVSLQNGVDNVEKLAASGLDALGAAVFVAAQIERPGEVVHRGRGDLVLGHPERTDTVEQVAGCFERASVPCRVSPRIDRELWTKMCINSMANAISALTGATYGSIVAHDAAWRVATDVAREAVAVARASGIDLDETEAIRTGLAVCRSVGPATSSTEQDLQRRRPTEIDALNGYLVRRGEALGIPTPVNHVLWALVKLREQTPR